MRYWVTYPLAGHGANRELATRDAVERFARTAEAAGFDGIGFTDHSAPTHRWLQAGGHDALDPFAALAFVAALTQGIRLIPNICVLPYRNPFVVAKSVASVDLLSRGRFILAVGTGYLRGEFKALGVDPDERNELFDDALVALRGIWSQDDFAFSGRGFDAVGQTANPKPLSRIPVWIGGNSGRARQRVADRGDGWSPFAAPAVLARSARTAPLESVADLRVALDDLWRRCDEVGRDHDEIDVAFTTSVGGDPGSDGFDPDAHSESLDELAAIGMTWASVAVPGDSLDHALDTLQRYGEAVIRPRREDR